MRYPLIILALILFPLLEVTSQGLTPVFSEDAQEELSFYGDVMFNSVAEEHRAWASTRFQEVLIKILQEEGVQGVQGLPWFQLQTPPDSSFALITWQHARKEGHFIAHGLFLKDGEITSLSEHRESWGDANYTAFGPDEWPGAVYYRMIPFEHKGDQVFLLFGYHGWDGGEHLRVVDAMRIQDGLPIFGAPVFKMKDDPVRPDLQYRKTLVYAAPSSVRIIFEESDQMIVMDHLIPATTPEGKLTQVPDGSYEAFQLKDGYWVWVEKLYHQTQETPPGDGKPVEEKRDLFGRKQ